MPTTEIKPGTTPEPVDANRSVPAYKSKLTKSGAVEIDVPRVGVLAPPKRKRYWIGTLPDCPYWNVTVGGHTFPRHSGNPMYADDGSVMSGAYERGIEVELSDDELEGIVQSVGRRVMRPIGTSEKRGRILPIDGKTYQARPVDRPLGEFLYMVCLTGARHGVKSGDPSPMVPRTE